ncbi:MAG: zf-HC2 domain-containing protein [Desulfobacterales bacterium]|jgi:hypothetical protein
MKCFRAKKLLSSYLQGQLDKHSSMQLEKHLAACDACRRQMDDLTMLVGELKAMAPVKAPPDFLDQIHARLQPRLRRHHIAKTLFYPLRLKIPMELASAAALALLIVAVIGIQKEEKPISQKPQVVVSRSALEQKIDSNGLSRPLEKAGPMPAAKQRDIHKTETASKSIVLTVIVKSGRPDRLDDMMVLQDAASEPSHGKAAGLEETEEGSLTPFPTQKPDSQKPAEDRIKKRAPAKSHGAAADSDQVKRGVREQHQSDPDGIVSRVQALVQSLAGNIRSERKTGQTQVLRQITVDLPAGRYSEFIDELGRIAPFQTPPPPITLDQDSIRIQIRVIAPQK